MWSEERVKQRGRMLMVLTVLAVMAVANGAWLTYVHVNLSVGKVGAAQVCHALSRDGCAVTAGEYGALYGVPVALIGMAGAVATLVVGVVAYRRRREAHESFRAAALLLAAVSVLASLVMASLSIKADSYCPFCVGWYGLNLAMGGAAWMAVDARERGIGTVVRTATGAPLLAMVASFCFTLAGGLYLETDYKKAQLADRDDFLRLQLRAIRAQGKTKLPLDMMQSTGPRDAEVTIVEIADFECPHCRKLWEGIEQYTEGSGRSVRTAFVHYPLDVACNRQLEAGAHEFACLAAYAAECAGDQGKFFEYGAQLFRSQHALERESLLQYAGDLALDTDAFSTCLDAPKTHAKVALSIELARLLDVRATPTFFVNGYKFEGSRAPALLAASIETLVIADIEDPLPEPEPPGGASAVPQP